MVNQREFEILDIVLIHKLKFKATDLKLNSTRTREEAFLNQYDVNIQNPRRYTLKNALINMEQ